MHQMRSVIIVANVEDDHAQCMLPILERIGVQTRCLDLSNATGEDMIVLTDPPEAKFQFDGLDFTLETTVWWRRPKKPRVNENIVDERLKQYALTEWDITIKSGIELCQSRFVNHPYSEIRADLKPIQLRAAHSIGFSIPRSLITNDAKVAQDFIHNLSKEGRRCVFKSLVPGRYHFGETRDIVTVEGYEKELSIAPLIFQECIELGQAIRATIFGNKVFTANIISSDPSLIDWRIDPRTIYEPINLADSIVSKLKLILESLRLETGSFDLIIDRLGTPYFLEVNPSGQFLYLERYGFPTICDDFAHFLCGE
jgi:hypothetical protein